MKVWCVGWLPRQADGLPTDKLAWCACRSQPRSKQRYSDQMRTKCQMVVTLPVGVEFREPTCPECKERIKTK